MNESPSRVDQFRAEIADMKLKDPARGRDALLGWIGLGAMTVGVIVALVAYSLSHSTTDALQQRDAIVLGLLAVTLGVVGAALYVRNTLVGFLRFAVARIVYEQKAQTDRMVGAETPVAPKDS